MEVSFIKSREYWLSHISSGSVVMKKANLKIAGISLTEVFQRFTMLNVARMRTTLMFKLLGATLVQVHLRSLQCTCTTIRIKRNKRNKNIAAYICFWANVVAIFFCLAPVLFSNCYWKIELASISAKMLKSDACPRSARHRISPLVALWCKKLFFCYICLGFVVDYIKKNFRIIG